MAQVQGVKSISRVHELTMMLSGATKLTGKPTQTQPRMTMRFWPAERSSMRRRMSPNTPTLRSSRILAVNSCARRHTRMHEHVS